MAADMSKVHNVAIYLRKSRNELKINDLLEHHRKILVDDANSKGWHFKIYEEDAISGDNFKDRPVISGLLDKIEDNPDLYDGVMVVEYDRLSRGDSADFSMMVKLFVYADIYLITPTHTYDLTDQNDLMILGVKQMVARNELYNTKRRYHDGRKVAAKSGRDCCGDPPYPYIKSYIHTDLQHNKIVQQDGESSDGFSKRLLDMVAKKEAILDYEIIVDEDKRQVYNYIKIGYLYQHLSLTKICQHLNSEHIPTMYVDRYPNAKWQVTTIRRILENYFHCGYFCYNKHTHKWKPRAEKNIVLNNPKSDWIIGKGTHEVLKTEEEHEKIMYMLDKNEDFPKASGKYLLSGLLYCTLCKHSMSFEKDNYQNKVKIRDKPYIYASCMHNLHCKMRGCRADYLNDMVIDKILQYINVDADYTDDQLAKNRVNTKKEISKMQKEIEKHEKALTHSRHLLVEELLSETEYKEEKDFRTAEIEKLNKRIYDSKITHESMIPKVDIKNKIQYFKDNFKNMEEPEQNAYLKTFIKKVWYTRNGKDIHLEVEYL